MLSPVILAPLFLLLIGWACTRHPTAVVRLMSNHVDLKNPSTRLTKSQEIAKYVGEQPDRWPQQYPELHNLIRIVGTAAYIMFVIGVAIILLSWMQSSR
jgi:hypothetical protein